MNKYKKLIDIKNGNLLPLISDSIAFNEIVQELAKPFLDKKIDKVVSLEATGFIFGGAVAKVLSAGFIPIRKPDKLKNKTISTEKFDDHSGEIKEFEIQLDLIKKDDNLLIVDDWVQTGNQIKHCIGLLNRTEAKITGISVVLDESPDKFKKSLDYPYKFIINYADCWD